MQPHEENTLATKKRQFKKEKKEANFLKQCCNVQKQEELVSLFFLGLSQNLLGKKGNTLALLASGNVFFFFRSFFCLLSNECLFFFFLQHFLSKNNKHVRKEKSESVAFFAQEVLGQTKKEKTY